MRTWARRVLRWLDQWAAADDEDRWFFTNARRTWRILRTGRDDDEL
jgi:hypothetical protein